MSLTPTNKRVLRILLDENSTAETAEELAAELRTTRRAIEERLCRIYEHYGVRTTRGLLRVRDQIARDIQQTENTLDR